MSIFSQLKQQLSEQLSNLIPSNGLTELQASVDLSTEHFPLLAWLEAKKANFPHFFLQKRDENQAIASIGAVRTFYSLEKAQQFVHQTGFTLVGGIQFEGRTHFILPRLKLVKDSQNLTAYLMLDFMTENVQAVEFDDLFAEFENVISESSAFECHNTLLSSQSAYNLEQWTQNIAHAIQQIKQGEFSKVVLANATTLTFEKPISAYQLLTQSHSVNLGCYHFLWAENAQSAFIGSTPERLYLRKGQQLFTEALAGTVAVSDDPIETENNAQWLLNDSKNIYENQLVVDDITEHLRHDVTDFDISKPEIKRLHNVQHLRRKIEATLKKGVSDRECLSQIHPTAAIAGLPRQVAKAFIAEYEPFPRHWYAGTFGTFSPSQAEFCVMLRSALIQQNQITLYAGAGIVAESEAVSEWHEIERKSQALAKLL